jgi:DNA-binding transcriptional ArsR family regulator
MWLPNVSHVLDILGNPVRRQILTLLSDGPRTVGDIAADLPVSRPAVSRHLRLLEGAELVQSTPSGRRTLVELRVEGFDEARHWLDQFWTEALARFAMVAENTEEEK